MKTLNVFDSFLWAEEENTKKTLSQLGKDFRLYKHSFCLLCETIRYLQESTKLEIPIAKKIILMITTRNAQLMQSINILNSKGYYVDVKVLERCLLESMGLCAYFALNEEETENWIKSKGSIATTRLVDYIPLLLDVKGRSAIPAYGKLCKYVHTDVEAIASIIVDIDPKGISLALTPIFDKEKVSEISMHPILMLAILRAIFRDELTEKRNGEIIKLLKQYTQKHTLHDTKETQADL